METEVWVHFELIPRTEHQLLPNPGPKSGSSKSFVFLPLAEKVLANTLSIRHMMVISWQIHRYAQKGHSPDEGWISEVEIRNTSNIKHSTKVNPAHAPKENLSVVPCTSLITLHDNHLCNCLFSPLLFMFPQCRKHADLDYFYNDNIYPILQTTSL